MRTLILLVATAIAFAAIAAEPVPVPLGNRMLADYFERQVTELERTSLPVPQSAEEWEKTRKAWRGQLAEMLGLSPMPERTPLNVTKTGEVQGEGFVVENLHYQARPGLYVTANLYRPAKSEGRLPAILYVCGHANVNGKDGTSLGNKAGYEHHGTWFARHGYVCLVIDTVQLGEIRGEHHGTYSKGRWWWFSRGYTPAGLEAWSGIRGLDYLETRADVDATRFGVTGRSGGGAYSWWVAALDDRIKVAAPTAGITTLRNHVVDGAVEGHCDCMFMVNTHRWDYDKVAALIAPRPLLISNTDKDTIFPLDGVVAVHTSVRRIYKALGADGKLGLQISEGPHKDTQPLNAGAFAWFERWLKGADLMATLDEPAKKRVDPEQLRVLSGLPKDEINTKADETFVKAAYPAPVPANPEQWTKMRDDWMRALRTEVFAGWPKTPCDPALREAGRAESGAVVMRAWDFTPQEPWTLRLYVLHRATLKPDAQTPVVLSVLDEEDWNRFREVALAQFPAMFGGPAAAPAPPQPKGREWVSELWDAWKQEKGAGNEPGGSLRPDTVYAFIAPRGVGPTAWKGTEKQQTQRLRRFYLIGQTLDGMQTWDIRRSIAALREAGFGKSALTLAATGPMSGNALYASLFEDGIVAISLGEPPATHARGPVFLNVLKHLDMPQALAMAAARCNVRLSTSEKAAWTFADDTAVALGRREYFVRSEITGDAK
jgi:dienelactone hydrolase